MALIFCQISKGLPCTLRGVAPCHAMPCHACTVVQLYTEYYTTVGTMLLRARLAFDALPYFVTAAEMCTRTHARAHACTHACAHTRFVAEAEPHLDVAVVQLCLGDAMCAIARGPWGQCCATPSFHRAIIPPTFALQAGVAVMDRSTAAAAAIAVCTVTGQRRRSAYQRDARPFRARVCAAHGEAGEL